MAAVQPNDPAEEAAIDAGIAADPDNPEWTEAHFARARPAAEMLPRDVYRALIQSQAKRSRP